MAHSKFRLSIFLVFFSIFVSTWACQSNFFTKKEVKKESPKSDPWSEVDVASIQRRIAENCECGGGRRRSFRISGGGDADKNEFPFQAAIVYRNTRIPFCGGTLINSKFILTAAHCLLNLPKILTSRTEDFLVENDFQILLNAHKLKPLTHHSTLELYRRLVVNSWELDPEDAEQDFKEGTLRFDVKRKIFHPEFVTSYRKLGFDHDVGLVELRTPINFSLVNSPVPICLPTEDEPENYQGTTATTIGWGRMNFKDLTSGSPILQKLQMPVYSLDECSQLSGVEVTRSFICAGHQTKRKDIGKSDSGGPLVVLRSGKFVQIGIVSWGSGEEDGHVASAFTRVSEFLPWMFYHMTQSVDGSDPADISWCRDEFKIDVEEDTKTEVTTIDVILTTEATTTDINDNVDDTMTDLTTVESETVEPEQLTFDSYSQPSQIN